MQPTPVTDATAAGKLRKVRSSNSTVSNSGNFTATAPTTTEITTDTAGVIRPNTKGAGWIPTRVKVTPFGVGSDTNTFLLRILGWSEINKLWVCELLWQGTCTLTTVPGIAGTDVDENQKFCDTIATAEGNDGVDCQPFSPANDQIAHVVVDVKGAEFLEFQFDRNGSATSANALVKFL